MRSRRRWIIAVAFWLWGASPGFAATSQDHETPWGFVYAFRTLRLFELTGSEVAIGRLPQNQVVLTSSRVSRRHAAIRKTETGVEVVDVGSTNGSRLNGKDLRPLLARDLEPGDRIQIADELLLYHETLPELWTEELRLRLLTSIVKLSVHLPQDETRRSFGREEIVPAVTEARVDLDSGSIGLEHSVEVSLDRGFPKESGAFVGSMSVADGALELSLWALAGSSSMTSRRASFANLKHTVLRISIVEGGTERGDFDPSRGPWFPPEMLRGLFEIFPDDPEFSRRFAHALAEQERPEALRDAAESFAFRHHLDPEESDLLLRAARLKGLWVDGEISARGIGLKAGDKERLGQAVAAAWSWLARADELGVDEDDHEEAASVIRRAEERLARLE